MIWSPGARCYSTKMRKLRMLTDVNTDQQNSGLQAALVYDRETASRLGITPQMIDNTLYRPLASRKFPRCTRR